MLGRRGFIAGAAAGLLAPALPARAATADSAQVLIGWYRLVLELVRHTATYSPPVAARSFGYLGVIGWEALAATRGLTSLAGQLNGLTPLPPGPPVLDEALVLHAALTGGVRALFGNTGPTGQRAMDAMERRMGERAGVGAVQPAASLAHGRAVADHILAWAEGDGGAVVANMGFPLTWSLGTQAGAWVPTSLIRQQQAPLLPEWGKNRPLAMPNGRACPLPPPPAYSEEPGSAFHAEAIEVYETSRSLTDEQKLIARFWSDDPMLSPTPPGHWVTILVDIAERDALPVERVADGLARLGVAASDAFIACWQSKYEFDLLRPVTYIRAHIDKTWEPLLITPPFPEYPSGHSTLSGASAEVLTAIFGPDFAFEDSTHEADGLPVRSFPNFRAAAQEAALSRLYGGIHFRAAIDRGLEQGACVATHAIGLRML
ncbi:MAG: vanadium-dependent haloperoxidase [Cypionkella sp.]|nr:vanadium-dependent haloperoxidase [Cypionkella sp.]